MINDMPVTMAIDWELSDHFRFFCETLFFANAWVCLSVKSRDDLVWKSSHSDLSGDYVDYTWHFTLEKKCVYAW